MKPCSQAEKIVLPNTPAAYRLIELLRDARAIRETNLKEAVNE